MCGIVGILNFNGEVVTYQKLQTMTDIIKHRGPNGEGHFFEEYVGLGHRRLSIIDLSEYGHQPMFNNDRRYCISYNGEIYNFQQIKAELKNIGYSFRSKTDTEVVLKAIEEWGVHALNKFNGMFAFAVWDRLEKTLLLARDRYGIKPLYYYCNENVLVFASEVKAIIASGHYKADVSNQSLLEYLTFQNSFGPQTLFKDINILESGSYMTFMYGESPKKTVPIKYWDFNFCEPDQALTKGEYIEELDRLLTSAVSRQLVSDVPLGTYLSGGIDSGTVTALAAKQLPYINSFTCGFDMNSASGVELSYDEREMAEYMSYLFHTEHYEMVLKAGDMERVMASLSWHIEEPRVGQCYPNYYAAKLASKFVKVVLSGAGGDEIFAGYPWRYYRAVVNNDFEDYIDKYYGFWQRLVPNHKLSKMLAPIEAEIQGVDTREIFKKVFLTHTPSLKRPEDYINHSLYFEAKTFMHGLLVVEDKLSMAHSLETRLPFLDNELVDFASKIPARFKLGNLTEIVRLNENTPGPKSAMYYDKTKDGKLILRSVMEKYLPERITGRAKQGFSAPDASWFKGESIDYVRNLLCRRDARIYQYLDYEVVNQMISLHTSGQQNLRLLIWSLISLENWLIQFL